MVHAIYHVEGYFKVLVEVGMTRKDFIYIGLILVGLVGHFVIVGQAEHQSSWCETFYEEYRKGL